MTLHPDKLAGVARAIQTRPKRPQRSAEQAAITASNQRPIAPKSGGERIDPAYDGTEGGLIEKLAFRLHDKHWQGFLDRMARGGVAEGKPASADKPSSLGVKPAPRGNKPESTQPVIIAIQPPFNA